MASGHAAGVTVQRPGCVGALYWETIGQLPQSQLPPISFSAMIETIVDSESQGDIQSQVQTF
jgi:hypothetical protein